MAYKIIGGDGEEYGPVDSAEVRQWVAQGRADGQTMIQHEGSWKPLAQVPEFAPLFGGMQGQPVPGQSMGGPPIMGGQPMGGMGQPIAKGSVPNYLVHSILVTLCCCLPFGIAAIVYASKVDTLLAQGNHAGAVEASESAKKWCIWALALGIIVNVLVIGLQIAAGTM